MLRDNSWTSLTPSCPLASWWLTVCSSCCSSLTVWFRPAVIFSFLSISSCCRENGCMKAHQPLPPTYIKKNKQTSGTTPRSYPLCRQVAVLYQFISIVCHFWELPLNQIQWLLGLDQAKKKKFHWFPLWTGVGTIATVQLNKWLPYTSLQPPFASRSLLSPAWTESEWAEFSAGTKTDTQTRVLQGVWATQWHVQTPRRVQLLRELYGYLFRAHTAYVKWVQ